MKEIGVYVHIPFCKRKCYYCDFCSFSCSEEIQYEYVNALINEINNYSEDEGDLDVDKSYIVNTIYIGGGTPSILDENCIARILKSISSKFAVNDNAEITIEVNPGTADIKKIEKYKQIGINRLSIGLQSTNNNILKSIGRIHTYEQFEKIYEIARNVGFSNINVDLMVGLPNQSIIDVEDSLKKIVSKSPEHISVYSLILEDETKLKDLVDKGIYTLPSEQEERDMYWRVKNFLEEHQYKHYEISNFAKEGFESRHNSDCWNQKEYIGFGLAAHSYLNNKRFSNTCSLDEYIQNSSNGNFQKNREIHEKQDIQDKMNEYIILKLRMIEGLNIDYFNKKFSTNFMSTYKNKLLWLQNQKLVSITNGYLKLTNKGIDFANMVWSEFL